MLVQSLKIANRAIDPTKKTDQSSSWARLPSASQLEAIPDGISTESVWNLRTANTGKSIKNFFKFFFKFINRAWWLFDRDRRPASVFQEQLLDPSPFWDPTDANGSWLTPKHFQDLRNHSFRFWKFLFCRNGHQKNALARDLTLTIHINTLIDDIVTFFQKKQKQLLKRKMDKEKMIPLTWREGFKKKIYDIRISIKGRRQHVM